MLRRAATTTTARSRGLASDAAARLRTRMAEVRPFFCFRPLSRYFFATAAFSRSLDSFSFPQELQLLRAPSAAAEPGAPPPLPPATPPAPPPPPKKRADKELLRRMPTHVPPPYVETNYRIMTFIMTRYPRMSDFPQERMYTKEGMDLLFRHYYKNSRS